MLQKQASFRRASVTNPDQKVADLPYTLCGNPKAITWFIRQGGDVNAPAHGMEHVSKPLLGPCRDLLKLTRDVLEINCYDSIKTMQTPLHIAAENDSQEACHCLIDAGANPNAQSINGSTPLHDACRRRAWNAVGVLVHAGADVNIRNDFGKTARDIAEDGYANETILDMLQVETRLRPQFSSGSSLVGGLGKQERSARTAEMVRNRGLRTADVEAIVDTRSSSLERTSVEATKRYLSPHDLAMTLIKEAKLGGLAAQCIEDNEIDTDVLRFLDDDGFKEAGIQSSLERAKIKSWLSKNGLSHQ